MLLSHVFCFWTFLVFFKVEFFTHFSWLLAATVAVAAAVGAISSP